MEEIYLWEENFGEHILEKNVVGQGYESKVYQMDDGSVAKIFSSWIQPRNLPKRLKDLHSIDGLESIMTVPQSLVYVDMHLVGYTMERFGDSLEKIILRDNLSIDKRIELLKDIKELLVLMGDKGIVHGDFQLKNVLYDGESTRISDINNVKFGRYKKCLLNNLTLYLSRYYGKSQAIDIQSFNYWCNILLNYRYDKIRRYVAMGADSYDFFLDDELKNKMFDQAVYEEQMDLIINPKENKKKVLENSKFLIDYVR